MASACVEQPAGAFFMFRRSGWEQLGGFDENFWPVWFEDVDFCARLRSAGFVLRYQPEARATHAGGHSVGRIPLGLRERYWYGSLLNTRLSTIGGLRLAKASLVGSGRAAGR